jgi:antirestriction protein ArdC
MYDKEEKRKLTNKEVYELREKLSDEEFKERVKPVSNTYTVFNAEQIEGIPKLVVASQEYDKEMCIEIRDDVLKGLGVSLNEGGNKAFYRPSEDSITMPPIESFWAEYNYLSTFLHEAGHSTGHESRLNRDLTGIFGSEKYAKEELRAEIASAFTTQAIGLEGTMSREHIDNHKAYIQSWIAEIKNDPNELFKAINDATKISDYLIEKCNLKRFIREFAPEESIDETRDYDAMLEKLQKQSLKKIDDNPYIPEKVAGYGLPNHKNTEVHQQELRRIGHVRR